MLLATNRGSGMNIGFPDPCLTPMGLAPVVIPYPNLALHGASIGFSVNVLFTGVHALTLATRIAITTGDEGGVTHPTIKGMGAFVVGNPIVFVNFLAAICLLCPTTGNNMNNGLGAVLVPSVTTVFLTYRGAGGDARGAREPETRRDGERERGDGGQGDGERGDAERETWRAAAEGIGARGRALSAGELAHIAADLASIGRAAGPPVTGELLPCGTGRIEIRVFSPDVPARVDALVRAFEREGGRGGPSLARLVLDLRDNPGGDLVASAELCGDYLEAGTELFTLVDAEGDETVFHSHNPYPSRLPITVLVNGGTASAAEIFARCLAARGRADVLGGPMFGKDTAQCVIAGDGGAPVLATVGRVRLRAGREEACSVAGRAGEV